MGFLDKAKAMGTDLAAKSQEVVNQGQSKLNDSQVNKRAAGLLEQLGAWQWAQQHGRDGGQADEQLARVIAELEAHEEANGEIAAPLAPVIAADAPAPPPPSAGFAPPPPPTADVSPPPPPAATAAPVQVNVPEGGFTLD